METNKILNEIEKKWQKVELEKRYTEFQKGTQKLHEWGSVHEDLRNKYHRQDSQKLP